jgi:membrane associated rhomboid family serine protease
VIVLALNLAMGFIVPGISWQAHVGGVLTGALVAWILVRTRQGDRSRARRTQLVLVGAGLVAATVLGVLL